MAVILSSFSLINIVRHWTVMFLRPGYLSYVKTHEMTYVSQVNMQTHGYIVHIVHSANTLAECTAVAFALKFLYLSQF